MNGAETLVEMLLSYQTEVVFGLPGDTSVAFYDALQHKIGNIKHIMARDERSAAFMADVYARLTSKPGICEGPSGGGATYMLPGIVEANGSSIAMIAITTDNPMNYEAQGALTDLDQSAIYKSVSKWTAVVKSADAIPRFVRRAFRMATSGCPGAVHLSLPKDILAQGVAEGISLHSEAACSIWPSYRTRPAPDSVDQAALLLADASRPVIVAGGGVVSSGAFGELQTLACSVNAPVATTINGKGAIAESSPLSLGVIGANGGRDYANRVIQEADLVMFVGCRANYVDTDSWRVPQLNHPPTIIQIDVDPAVIGNNYPTAVGLCGDAKFALADISTAFNDLIKHPPERTSWLDSIAKRKAAWRGTTTSMATRNQSPILPQRVIHELQSMLPPESVIICDPGTPTPYVAAGFELPVAGRSVISPRAQGGLGYAIPGVVGARMARPDVPVFGLTGDGSFAMTVGELATVARVGGPTVIILFNNGCYGWIKALQKLYHSGRYFGVDFTEDLDYTHIARGFGLRAVQVTAPDDIGPALRKGLDYGSPYFIEVVSQTEHKANPPVASWQRAMTEHPGADIDEVL